MKYNEADIWEVTYTFVKPVLIRGYTLTTGDNEQDFSPKDWTVDCKDFFT